MLEQTEIDKLLNNLNNLKSSIKSKKQELNKLNSQKEGWFKKKKDVSINIGTKISELRKSKSKVTTLNNEVKELKSEKNEVDEKISSLIGEVKKLKQDYNAACDRHGIKDSPSFIKKKIDKLEFTLETSALGFEQEKRLNNEIKKLKKIYLDMADVSKIWNIVRAKEKEIRALKNQKSGTLNRLRKDNSQKYNVNEDFINNSQEIMDMRKLESEYYDNFSKLKDQFKVKNDELKDLLNQRDEILKTLEANKVETNELVKKAESEIIKEKSKEVNDKLKKKEKLTTEDLLVFQRSR